MNDVYFRIVWLIDELSNVRRDGMVITMEDTLQRIMMLLLSLSTIVWGHLDFLFMKSCFTVTMGSW